MWYFGSPRIVFGEGALEALDELQGRRALIVTDTTLVGLGLVDRVKAHLEKAGLEIEVFDAVEPDPSLETAHAGAAKALACEPDWIVGLGGGSAMDTAKAVWVLYERPDLEPAAINPFIRLGLGSKARLITIPTTSGTGSEVTTAIVLTDKAEQRKVNLINREIMADMALVDPDLVMGMPARLTAETGLDALTHAIEGYTCTWHNDMADGLCLHACKLIWTYLPRACADGTDREAREKMHNAAALAGLGFGNSLVSLAHAMGHALGATFHVSHGRAVGLFLPYTVEFMSAQDPERFAELAAMIGCTQETPAARARTLASQIRDLCRKIDVPTTIAHLGIERTQFVTHLDELVEKGFNDGSILTAVRCPSFDELRRLFVYAYDGKRVDF